MSVAVRRLSPDETAARLGDLARLRIEVFREWPYLYDGELAYERRYLAAYAAPSACVVGAFDGDAMVGAATAAPMEDHASEFGAAAAALGRPPEAVWYLAESVLLPTWRGRGLGHRFFDLREAAGCEAGRAVAAFCAVRRPADHPMRPAGARDLAPFWRARGYAPVPGGEVRFAWRDLGRAAETEKALDLWARPL